MNITYRGTLLLLAILSLHACSGEEGAGGPAALEPGSRLGLVSVTHEHDWGTARDDALLTTTAQFVRYRSLERHQVARLLALPLEPGRDLPAAADRCDTYDLSLHTAADIAIQTEERATVDLLEAGDLQVRTQDNALTLFPRHFPGLLPFISGVVYGEASATQAGRAGEVTASSNGGDAVGPFEARVVSPEVPDLTQVGATTLPGPRASVSPARDMVVRWAPGRVTADTVTYLEVRYSDQGLERAARCRVQDDGHFEVPARIMAHLGSQARMELCRMRSAPFQADGLDQAELRVVVKESVDLRASAQ